VRRRNHLTLLPTSAQENAAAAKEELSRAWLYQGDTRDEVTDYFNQLNDPNWKLCSARNGLEVWRLPGEKIHRIMGCVHSAQSVNQPPASRPQATIHIDGGR
jgi:hypothetical protein